MSTATPLLKTATAYFEAISDLDTALLRSVLAENYQHTFAPESAGFGPAVDSAGMITRFETLPTVFASLPTQIKQIWPNEEAKQVTVWVTRHGNFHPHIKQDDGDDAWFFHNEYMFVLDMDPSGEKITKALEFVDSKGTDEMLRLVGKAFGRAKVSWWRPEEETRP